MKRCTKCRELKAADLFHKHPLARDGRRVECKKCTHARTAYARKTKEGKALAKVYGRRSMLKHRYGISDKIYDQMLQQQDGKCMICQKTEQGEPLGRRLAVDHCKHTKIVRSLLCHKCNRGLGLFGHHAGLLKRAAAYLEFFHGEASG